MKLILKLIIALTCQIVFLQVVHANFFFDTTNDSKNENGGLSGSKSIKPVLDEFVHGSAYYTSLSVEELINFLSMHQSKQTKQLTKVVEEKTKFDC